MQLLIFCSRCISFGNKLKWNSIPVNQRKDVKHGGNVWVIMPTGLFQVFKRLFAEGNRDLVSTLRSVLNDQVVERPQSRWDLVTSGGSTGQSRLRSRERYKTNPVKVKQLSDM